jgi:putative SOS response-associated peptidase YedK
MCGRYVSPDSAAIERAFHVGRGNNAPFARRYNVQPTTTVAILRRPRDASAVELAQARWGLIPHWWKDEAPPKFTFNARLEEAAGKPMWREPLRHARCLVPAEGWYEWRAIASVDPRSHKSKIVKQPHYIRRADSKPFCFAGLLSFWTPQEGGLTQMSCSILTRAATGPVAEVHERMPVALDDAALEHWLDPQLADAARVNALIGAHALSAEFSHFEVSTRVNNSRSEGAQLIEPLAAAFAAPQGKVE